MKLPRDLSGADFARALQVLGYRITRQTAAGTQTIEVPGNAVPAALRDRVTDVLE